MYFAGGYFYMAYLSKQLTQLDEHLGEWEEPEEHEHEGTLTCTGCHRVCQAHLSVVDEDGNLIRGEQDNDSWFIPMQYPERLPRVMYRQSDPEWQEFVKISWDEQRKATVRGMPLLYHKRSASSMQRLTLTQKSLHRAWLVRLADMHI